MQGFESAGPACESQLDLLKQGGARGEGGGAHRGDSHERSGVFHIQQELENSAERDGTII